MGIQVKLHRELVAFVLSNMTYHKLFVGCILLLASFGNSNAAEEYQYISLRLHNELRAKHPGTPSMILDETLNQKAVLCAKHYLEIRRIDHSCTYKTGSPCGTAGENLYAAWSSGSVGHPNNIAKSAINSFYNEKKYYNYETGTSAGGVTGHFTQLVWVDSTLLGAGVALSANGTNAYAAFLYCKHGNVVGSYTEMVKSAQVATRNQSIKWSSNSLVLLALIFSLLVELSH